MSSWLEQFIPVAVRGRLFIMLASLVSKLKAPKDLLSDDDYELPCDKKILADRVAFDLQPLPGARPRLNLLSGDDNNLSKVRAVILYFHPGGFCIRGKPDDYLTDIGQRLGAEFLVYSGEYRLAPEHRFPASHDDADTLLAEIVSRYPKLPIILGGASAGGHLAGYSASRTTSKNLKGVYLNCPNVTPNRDTPSRLQYATSRYPTVESLDTFLDCYGEIPDLSIMAPPQCPVLMHAAAEDVLFSDGDGLSWPNCRKRVFPSALHDFIHSSKPLCGASYAAAVKEVVEFIQEVITP